MLAKADNSDDLRLTAGLLDLGLGAGAEPVRLDGQGVVQLTAAQNLDAVELLTQQALQAQASKVHGLAGREGSQGSDVDGHEAFSERILEADLGEAALQRHLSAFETLEVHVAAAGLLSLAATAGGLAQAGALAAPDALAFLGRAPWRLEVGEFHDVFFPLVCRRPVG